MQNGEGSMQGSNAAGSSKSNHGKVQQPKPQALPTRTGPSSILVSYRQKGNPILNSVRAMPWEYADTPADYVLGLTTCALFLSLKYHRLHPEYIYSRIRGLQGKYNLRILLTMVDIQNHEDSLKELSKTSLINDVTIILCWSAQEAGRYLELFKSYENAAPTKIKAQQATTYADQSLDFITVPRSINKTDALGLISSFGSMRTAVSARPEEVALVDGWGQKKVQRWCSTVIEPFRLRKAAKRSLGREESSRSLVREESGVAEEHDTAMAARLGIASDIPREGSAAPRKKQHQPSEHKMQDISALPDPDDDELLALQEAEGAKTQQATSSVPKKPSKPGELSAGIAAELERLRNAG